MAHLIARSLQSVLLSRGVEVRKAPANQKRQIPVFQVLVNLMMQLRPEPLTFVQVGANDGVHGDPLRAYILKCGWRGVLVEPQPDVFATLKHNYKKCADRLIFENIAISPDYHEVTLFRAPGYKASIGDPMNYSLTITSVDPSVVSSQSRVAKSNLERVLVPAITLNELIERHGCLDLDILQIDCEGYDSRVLDSIDLARHRPKLIQFEHGHLKRPELSTLESRFERHEYRLLYGGRFADSLVLANEFIASLR